MSLFHVQDPDRPMWVVARDWGHAVDLWKAHLAHENECKPEDIEEPQGVTFVCEQDDLLLTAVYTGGASG